VRSAVVKSSHDAIAACSTPLRSALTRKRRSAGREELELPAPRHKYQYRHRKM
jgi:hypothetical protein